MVGHASLLIQAAGKNILTDPADPSGPAPLSSPGRSGWPRPGSRSRTCHRSTSCFSANVATNVRPVSESRPAALDDRIWVSYGKGSGWIRPAGCQLWASFPGRAGRGARGSSGCRMNFACLGSSPGPN